MKKRKKGIVILAVAVVLLGAAFMVKYFLDVASYRQKVASIKFQHQDASGLPDGLYRGECDVKFIYARVEVEVADGAFARVEVLEHKHDRGGGAEAVAPRILKEQKVDVAVVSGATNSSQTIKKAVDNALGSEKIS